MSQNKFLTAKIFTDPTLYNSAMELFEVKLKRVWNCIIAISTAIQFKRITFV